MPAFGRFLRDPKTAVPFQAIETQRLYQRVAHQIASLINAETFAIGERLPPERELAARLKVSRPVVREAMIALELAGLVEVRMGAGVFVVARHAVRFDPVKDDDPGPGPFELLEARMVVESEAAALAAERISEEGLAELDAAIAHMIDENARDFAGEAGDRRFHLRLAQSSGNSVLASMVETLWALRDAAPMWEKLHERIHAPDIRPQWVSDHREILSALRRRDPDAARAAVRRHLEAVRETLLRASEAERLPLDVRHEVRASLMGGGRR